MDDLFQSLAAAGQGTHRSGRSDAETAPPPDGAFGATFDAVVSTQADTGAIPVDIGVPLPEPQPAGVGDSMAFDVGPLTSTPEKADVTAGSAAIRVPTISDLNGGANQGGDGGGERVPVEIATVANSVINAQIANAGHEPTGRAQSSLGSNGGPLIGGSAATVGSGHALRFPAESQVLKNAETNRTTDFQWTTPGANSPATNGVTVGRASQTGSPPPPLTAVTGRAVPIMPPIAQAPAAPLPEPIVERPMSPLAKPTDSQAPAATNPSPLQDLGVQQKVAMIPVQQRDVTAPPHPTNAAPRLPLEEPPTRLQRPEMPTAPVNSTVTAAPPEAPAAAPEGADKATPKDEPARASLASREGPPLRTGGWTLPHASAPPVLMTSPSFSTASSPVTLPAIGAVNDLEVEGLPDLDFGLHATLSALSTTALTPTSSVLTHAPSATAQVIGQQIAAALSRSTDADAPLELALDPPELGRVRMQMTEIAGVMTLTIQTERPETADLMRRHLDLLAQEFSQAGLDAPSVHISQEGADQGAPDGRDQPPDAAPHLSSDAALDAPPPHSRPTADGALDLRL